MSRYYYFSSNSRTSSSSSTTNFTIKLTEPIRPSSGKLRLHHIVIPSSVFNIDDNNKYLDVIYDSTTYAVLLLKGFYGASALASMINTQLASQISSNLLCSWDSNRLYFRVYDSPATKNVQVLASSGANMASSNLWKVMGWTDPTSGADTNSASDSASNTSITTIAMPQLHQPESFYITFTTNFGSINDTAYHGPRSCSMVFPRAGSFDAVSIFNGKDYPVEIEANSPIFALSIKITDESGTTVDNHGAQITFMLEDVRK